MAQQVFGIAGAAVGFVVSGFNPAGAQWGWAIGSTIGTPTEQPPENNLPRPIELLQTNLRR